MSDQEILVKKLNFSDSEIPDSSKQTFLDMLLTQRQVFSIRDEIGLCPYFQVHLQVKKKPHVFVRPYRVTEDQKVVMDREMSRLCHLGVIEKGHASFSSPCCIGEKKNIPFAQGCHRL